MAASNANPITNPNGWSTYSIAGLDAPGTIPRGGIRGFERPTGWDKKIPKGGSSATLTRVTAPPAEGAITSQLMTADDLDAWESFIAQLQTPPAKADAPAFAISHPALAQLKITSVVVHKIHPVQHVGKGMYLGTIEYIEWRPPEKKNIVSTPSKAAPNPTPNELPGIPPNPVIDALKQQLINEVRKAQGLP